MMHINLLPWRQMQRKEMDRQLMSVAIGLWMLMGLIILYGHLRISAEIDTQQKRNEFLTQQIAKLDVQLKEIEGLKKQRDALIARMNVIYQLQQDRTHIVHVFDEVTRRRPEGVYFRTLSHSRGSIGIDGVAQSNGRVSALMRGLEASDWLSEPKLGVINVRNQTNGRVSEFTMQVGQQKGPK